MKMGKYLEKKNQLGYSKFLLYLKIYSKFENMVTENKSKEFRFKNIDETRNYFVEEIEQKELTSNKHQKVCTTLNYIEHFLILASAVTGRISISAFAYLLGISIGITRFAIERKICTIPAGIKKFKLIIRKKKGNIIK